MLFTAEDGCRTSETCFVYLSLSVFFLKIISSLLLFRNSYTAFFVIFKMWYFIEKNVQILYTIQIKGSYTFQPLWVSAVM